ncbi:lysozyme inhibitor LprI family protein [Polaromonas sp.]|uniref:lysozyme inhibitor LprI family protein n=1 Tax=Polaromonas sp. TaxID=1869339 RepID=UPI0035239138
MSHRWSSVFLSSGTFASVEKPECGDGEYHWQAFQNECSLKRYAAADKVLNATYRALFSRLSDQERFELRYLQRE